MRFERMMAWLCFGSCGLNVVQLTITLATVPGFPFDDLSGIVGYGLAWLGWLAALRWREASDISAETVHSLRNERASRIKESWDTP